MSHEHLTVLNAQFLTSPFSGTFAITPKSTISFVMSVCPSVRMDNSAAGPTDGFSWNLIFEYFSRIRQENGSSLLADKNNGTLHAADQHTVLIISRSVLLRMRKISDKDVKKIKTNILCSTTFFGNSYRLWDNVEKYCGAEQATVGNTIRRMCFARWITKTADTHSEFVMLIAFLPQNWLNERASMLRYTYIACLSVNIFFVLQFWPFNVPRLISDHTSESLVFRQLVVCSIDLLLVFLCSPYLLLHKQFLDW